MHNREALYEILPTLTVEKTSREWVEGLAELKVPAGPVNDLKQVFDDPQIRHRGMEITMDYPESESGEVKLIGNPIKLSATPVSYRHPPPREGQHSDQLLRELLDLDEAEIARLREQGII